MLGIVINQHMLACSADLRAMYCERLNWLCKLEVREARVGGTGCPWTGPSGAGRPAEMRLVRMGLVMWSRAALAKVNGHRPSVDVV